MPPPGIIDGAVFAFVHGTDPEVFLVLESRVADKDKAQLALHACADDLLGRQVSSKEKQVWSAPERLNKSTAAAICITFGSTSRKLSRLAIFMR